MSSGVVKTVEVKDLEDGRYEISYKGAGHKIYQLFGAAILIVVALPAGCSAFFATFAKKNDGPLAPDGQVKFPHPWPPQIPPGRTGQIMTTRG